MISSARQGERTKDNDLKSFQERSTPRISFHLRSKLLKAALQLLQLLLRGHVKHFQVVSIGFLTITTAHSRRPFLEYLLNDLGAFLRLRLRVLVGCLFRVYALRVSLAES